MSHSRNIRQVLFDKYHVSEIVAMLGHPPLEVSERRKRIASTALKREDGSAFCGPFIKTLQGTGEASC
jgi:hypothetical protein